MPIDFLPYVKLSRSPSPLQRTLFICKYYLVIFRILSTLSIACIMSVKLMAQPCPTLRDCVIVTTFYTVFGSIYRVQNIRDSQFLQTHKEKN